MLMARVAAPGDENAGHGMPYPYNSPLPTAHYFHNKCPWRWVFAAPVHENAVAVSGGWGMVGATPET